MTGRSLLAVAVALVFVTTAHAQDGAEDTISQFIQKISGQSHEQCAVALTARIDSYRRAKNRPIAVTETLRLASEGHRLGCESLRLLEEADRITGERRRLLTAAERLDEKWHTALATAPGRYEEFPGRDASQRRMRKDADILDATARQLRASSEELKKESSRVFSVSVENMATLENYDGEMKMLKVAVDAQSQLDVLIRLIGGPKKS